MRYKAGKYTASCPKCKKTIAEFETYHDTSHLSVKCQTCGTQADLVRDSDRHKSDIGTWCHKCGNWVLEKKGKWHGGKFFCAKCESK